MKEIKIECPDCKGTGLYKGCCEHGSCAVVCRKCGGTGYTTFKYNEFTGKKVREGITRVFGKSCGFVHMSEDYRYEDGRTLHFSRYGCTYQDWLNGVEPRPMEELVCPYYYYNNGIGNEPLDKCRKNLEWGDRISECKKYNDKVKCWEEFNRKVAKYD